ncbi:MAG TPA: YbaK/EbsC family protein [Kiloniellaceae bacterium]|nr:YbaK/EbsC family protein [Kiloniellaceae bacterium]
MSETGGLKAASRRVDAALSALGVDYEIRTHDSSARSAEEAAATVGCPVGQIAKSLIFRSADGERAVLAIASGGNRVDEKALAKLLGEKIGRADADFVRRQTGYAIGGVPPLAHAQEPVVFIDRDLMAYETIWAAAGTPNSVVRLQTADLPRITGGRVADFKTL